MRKKILLLMQPFWTPLIPPQGISYLKNFLQYHNYIVKTEDANTQSQFRELYIRYFGILEKYIPADKQGNFYNIGHDVLRNHMMAHIHYKDERVYGELVKVLVYQTFFTAISDQQVNELKEVLDLFYARMKDYILDLLEKEKPEVLGISVLRDTIASSMFAFRLTREKYPDVMTVMGGSVFSDHLRIDSPNFGYFLEKTPYIDKIIVGEGQILLLKLLRGELSGTRRIFTREDIEGETMEYSSFDYKFPDMTDFDVERDYPYLAAQASSSCPNQCSFCNVAAFYGKYKEKNPAQTAAEMIKLYKTYGKQLFFMNDALLNGVATALSEEFLKTDIALYWDGYLRVAPDVCNPENTIAWRRGGMYRVRLGVESGSQHVLDLMDKAITPELTRAALASLANAGIKTTTYWVIGHPGETEADFLKTLELLEELKNDIYEAECNPFIFGYSGQAKTRQWEDQRVLLYPEESNDMLIIRTWRVDCPPSREETYERVNRFAEYCKRLGIPNPYSLHEIYQADNRWEILHKNAVPRLVEFRKEAYINECKRVKQVSFLKASFRDDGDFGF